MWFKVYINETELNKQYPNAVFHIDDIGDFEE